MLKFSSPTDVDFWIDFDKYSNLISKDTSLFNIDMIRLVSIRKSISNFVKILTQRNIPVYFNSEHKNFNSDGKYIYLSASIKSKEDFEVAVGQSLHEGSHSLKTNFDLVKRAFLNIPSNILRASDSKNISRKSLESFILHIWNVIEDRYIDDFVFNEAPGYRGYYVSLYNRFWNCEEIDIILKDNQLFRYPSLDSYKFRITNFTNSNTDLDALPRLCDIAKVIDISNISRLKLTRDRIKVTFDVVEIVLDCIHPNISDSSESKHKRIIASPDDFFDFGDSSDDSSESVDVGKKMIDEISDVIKGNNHSSNSQDIVNKISVDSIPYDIQSKIDNILESQRNFISGEFKKDTIDEKQERMLDLIEKSGIDIIKVDVPGLPNDNVPGFKVDCIVVQKMTSQLIFSENDIFPLSLVTRFGNSSPDPESEHLDAILKGIALGRKLGKLLQIRSESNPVKSIRKKHGKIYKRHLYEASFDSDKLFYKTTIEQYNKASIHISIDASSSMKGDKWYKTMTSVTAICKAASMIDNIHVTVSIRTTQLASGINIPYVVMAYDSNIDNFSKVRKLFPYLSPVGFTPEGLAYSAIMKLFDNITPDDEDRYFLNFSDGEPCYQMKNPISNTTISYMDEIAVQHTKSQVDKIRKNNITILSYFIDNGHYKKDIISSNKTKFQKMYGRDAKFINVEDVIDLATTINNMFLSKRNEND